MQPPFLLTFCFVFTSGSRLFTSPRAEINPKYGVEIAKRRSEF